MKIAFVILTLNEENYIEKSLRSIRDLADHILICDSFSSDNTLNIARQFADSVIVNKFVCYSEQLNFAISSLPSSCDYVFRLDADEIILFTRDQLLNSISSSHDGYTVTRHIEFAGNRLKFGKVSHRSLRLFRKTAGLCSFSVMDEKIVVDGSVSHSLLEILDVRNLGFDQLVNKHLGYAYLEAIQFSFFRDYGDRKRSFYYKLPPFLRSFLFFVYRYVLMLGFLDGRRGFIYHLVTGLLYRSRVDELILIIGSLSDDSRREFVLNHAEELVDVYDNHSNV